MLNKKILAYYYYYQHKIDLYKEGFLYRLSIQKARIAYYKPTNKDEDR